MYIYDVCEETATPKKILYNSCNNIVLDRVYIFMPLSNTLVELHSALIRDVICHTLVGSTHYKIGVALRKTDIHQNIHT